jgi:hypothetical protein
MNEQSSVREEQLVKRIRRQLILIGFMTVVIIGALFIYFFKDASINPQSNKAKSVKFIEEVDDEIAIKGIENYESVVRLTDVYESKGVLFDTGEILKYINETYPEIIKRHGSQMGSTPIPNGYTWKLCFHWTVRNDRADPNKKRLAFYVLPLLYNKTTNTVLDYFSVGNNKYYNHPLNGTDPKNIYDEGQLWP